MTTGAVTIRVALADDHSIVREGLIAFLKSDPTIELVGEASDGLQAVELVQKVKPDVLLLDLKLPRLHGIEVLRQLREQKHTAIVVVSMHSDEPYILEAFRNGVSGYVLKDSPGSELLEAIRSAARGEQYVSEAIQRRVVHASVKRLAPGAYGPSLTKRELQVLDLAAQGRTSGDVAQTMTISRRTAEAHRANLMRKLGLKTQTDLVLYAIRSGVITA